MKAVLCRNATPFTPDGRLDESGFAEMMERFVDARVGVYIGTAGSGESHALSNAELHRLYRIGVEVGAGRIPVYANPPEQHTPAATIEQSLIAANAGIEVVNVYGPAGWHGFKPTDAELLAFFDEVLSAVQHPVALNPNGTMGYVPSVKVVAEITRRHRQVVHINLATEGDAYYLAMRDALDPSIRLYVNMAGSAQLLQLGAAGVLTAEATIIPRTFRRYLDGFEARDIEGMNRAYAECLRFSQYVRKWGPSNARWLKMAARVLGLPGGGGLRPPYRFPPDDQMQTFADGLGALGIPEIDELLRAK